MRTLSLLSGLLVAGVMATPTAGQDPVHPTGDSRPGLDVTQYTFRVEFSDRGPDAPLRIMARTTAIRRAPVTRLALDLVRTMRVDSVSVNARRAPFTRTGDSVIVALPPGGDTVSVAVFYEGIPTDGLILRRDTLQGWTAFGDNFPDRARQWLAVVDHPSDKALVEWEVITPGTHRVIANGALLEETPILHAGSPPRLRTRWRTDRPIYTAVMVIGVAPFSVLELGATACGLGEHPGCVAQSVWVPPSQRAVIPGQFARAGEIVALFSQLAGPVPYEKLAHVSSSTRYGGMENAGAIFYASELFTATGPTEGLIAHETAHQWFGDAVTEREWPHVWLSESFATYFAALWAEHAHGDTALRAELVSMRSRVLASPVTLQLPVINDRLDDLRNVLNTNVYQKGGFVLHMLRTEIGDSAFFGGVRAYYAAHRHGNALTADLQQAMEASAGRSLEWFFAQWLRRPGYADVTPSWRWDAARRVVLVTVLQRPGVAPYRLSLAADITGSDGVTSRVRVAVPAEPTATIEIPASTAPTRISFDADASVLGVVRDAATPRRAP